MVSNYEDLVACMHLVMREFVSRKYMDDTPENRDQIMKDYLDGRHTVFAAKVAGAVVGTSTTVEDDSRLGLPIDSIFPEAEEFRRTGGRGQITYFAIKRSIFGEVMYESLMAVTSQTIRRYNRHIVVTINERHSRMYDLLGFGHIANGEKRGHDQVKALAIGRVLTMDDGKVTPYAEDLLSRPISMTE